LGVHPPFGDAANKAIGYIKEISPALIAIIIISAACGMVFSKGHKAEILGSAFLAIVLIVSFEAIGKAWCYGSCYQVQSKRTIRQG